jgi:acetyltransferase-like isoleucine patch superfamily enzyme
LTQPKVKESGFVDVIFGENVTVVTPANLYGCKIGDNVFIGPFVEVQRDVTIGDRTKVQSHSFICELVEIGHDCFVGHGVMFINDLFSTGGPARGDKSLWKRTKVGNHVSIGSNVSVLPISICDHVVIGAGSVVTKDIEVPGVYVGNPARLIRKLTPN